MSFFSLLTWRDHIPFKKTRKRWLAGTSTMKMSFLLKILAPGMYVNPVNSGISTTKRQLVNAGFQPSTVVLGWQLRKFRCISTRQFIGTFLTCRVRKSPQQVVQSKGILTKMKKPGFNNQNAGFNNQRPTQDGRKMLGIQYLPRISGVLNRPTRKKNMN